MRVQARNKLLQIPSTFVWERSSEALTSLVENLLEAGLRASVLDTPLLENTPVQLELRVQEETKE
jgi:hypothetical protein